MESCASLQVPDLWNRNLHLPRFSGDSTCKLKFKKRCSLIFDEDTKSSVGQLADCNYCETQCPYLLYILMPIYAEVFRPLMRPSSGNGKLIYLY